MERWITARFQRDPVRAIRTVLGWLGFGTVVAGAALLVAIGSLSDTTPVTILLVATAVIAWPVYLIFHHAFYALGEIERNLRRLRTLDRQRYAQDEIYESVDALIDEFVEEGHGWNTDGLYEYLIEQGIPEDRAKSYRHRALEKIDGHWIVVE